MLVKRWHRWKPLPVTLPQSLASCISFSMSWILLLVYILPGETVKHDSSRTVTLLSFTPSLDVGNGNVSPNRCSWLLSVDEHDLLSEAAISLAVERVNRDEEILANYTLGVASLSDPEMEPVFTQNRLQEVTNTLRSIHPSDIFGVIGPQSPEEAKFWAPVFQRANILTVSHDITTTSLNHISAFYHTLPSDFQANIGRLVLMANFGWYRVAVINSNETYYVEIGNNFTSLYMEIVRRFSVSDLSLTTTFSDSPDAALREIRNRDIRIVFGFFSETKAHDVLCKAKSLGLVSEEHAWILPAYYSPNWWKYENESTLTDGECLNDEMEKILESVIFVKPVKVLPNDIPLDEFHDALVNKVLEVFPSFTTEDLMPYLFRSNAASAYDAITLLARSIDLAMSLGGNSFKSINKLQNAFEYVMYCEYCRLNFECFLDMNETEDCKDLCDINYQPILAFENILVNTFSTILDKDLRTEYLINGFGQILYSQFIGGDECPVALLWRSRNQPETDLQYFYTLDELDGMPCASRLNISSKTFVRDNSSCPLSFQWKGSTVPTSDYFTNFNISVGEMVVIGLLTIFGLVIAVAFLLFNIIWRNNRNVKGTSPWLNVVFTIGIIVRLPASLFDSLAISTDGYGFNERLIEPLCHVSDMAYYIGEGVFLAALIMKNWRIYRLFHNKSMKRLKNLTDFRLILCVLLAQIPLVAILIVKAGFFHTKLRRIVLQNENLQFVYISFCASEKDDVFDLILTSYNGILSLVLLVFAFLNTLVHISKFRSEGTYSFKAALVLFIPQTIFTVVRYILISFFQLAYIYVILWMDVILGIVLPTLIMCLLFIPTVWQMVRSGNFYTRDVTIRKKPSVSVTHYHQLLKRKEALNEELMKIRMEMSNLLESRL